MYRRLFSVFLLIYCLSLSAQQIGDAFKGVIMGVVPANAVSLNGDWKFRFMEGQDWSKYKDFFQTGYNDQRWETIPVPGNWDVLGYTKPRYGNPEALTGLYRRWFTVPENWRGEQVFLRFDGVLRGYDVWVNGRYVGKWESSYNSCQFDITPYLTSDENLLSLRVYTVYKGSDFDGNDDWAQVGISRDINIFPVPQTHVKDITIKTLYLEKDKATIGLDVEAASFSSQAKKQLSFQGSIIAQNGQVIAEFEYPILNNKKLHKEITIKKPQLWTAETPSLYRLSYRLKSGKEVLQSGSEKFGIRLLTIEGNVIKLNGVAIKLRGVTLHETDPFEGKVISKELILTDMRLMKEANINFIRTSHYPHAPLFYELCDSLGFYVMNEVPFGFGDQNLTDTTFQDILLTRANATVLRDKNHPCILFWSIGNENPLTPITEVTGQYVKKLDSTRPICYPQQHSYFLELKYNLPDFVDIYAPHYPPVQTLEYYAKTATKPVILTEYCHSLGQSLEEHKELWEIIEANTNLAGGNIWEWVDQGMSFNKRKKDFFTWTDNLWLNETGGIYMNGNQGADGLLYANRIPLSNYYEVQRNYAQSQLIDTTLILSSGKQTVPLRIRNRYDFINLQGNVDFQWYLTLNRDTVAQGKFSPDCQPHSTSIHSLDISLPQGWDNKLCLLHFSMTNKQNARINTQTIRVFPSDNGKESLVLPTPYSASSPWTYLQKMPLLRVGRKTSMSEDNRVSDKVIKHYLMLPQQTSNTYHGEEEYDYSNDEITVHGSVIYTPTSDNGIKLDFTMSPEGSDKLLLETGIGFLLSDDITKVQWIGNGPYASYPGKQSANEYGIYGLAAGDIYFEGNRMGIDLILCTNDQGDGILVKCDNGNFNFEQTDKGIVITYNARVSGLGGKLRTTSFPVYANQVGEIKGSFTLYPVKGSSWSSSMKDLFVQPETITPYKPFLSVYDIYLLKFNDIVK